jgi:hypothetical protein
VRVSSPIGDLPFTVRRVRIGRGEMVVEGELGAWRSDVRVGAADAPMLARAAARPLAVAAVGAAVVWILRRG